MMKTIDYIKEFIEYIFLKCGYIFIPKWRCNSYVLSRRMKRIISECKIDCVVDVGANVGQYYNFLRDEVKYKGIIISFEPDPENFEILLKNSQNEQQWYIYNFALGKENKMLLLNVMEKGTFNSFLNPANSLIEQFSEANTIKKKIEVSVRRLDDVLPRIQSQRGFKKVFLKMDTQGYDMAVFLGSTGCMDLILGIQTEVSVLPIYENMPEFEDSLKLFRSNGFEISGIYAVNEDRFPFAVEFDCILLSKKKFSVY